MAWLQSLEELYQTKLRNLPVPLVGMDVGVRVFRGWKKNQ